VLLWLAVGALMLGGESLSNSSSPCTAYFCSDGETSSFKELAIGWSSNPATGYSMQGSLRLPKENAAVG
jgi:hypothetical protein